MDDVVVAEHLAQRASRSGGRGAAAPPAVGGLRRVLGARLLVERDGLRGELVGIGHRLPRTQAVPVSTVIALLGTVPVLVVGPPGSPAGPGEGGGAA